MRLVSLEWRGRSYPCLMTLHWRWSDFAEFLSSSAYELNCSFVCVSFAAFHIRLLDRVVLRTVRHSNGLMVCETTHKRCVVSPRKFYMIWNILNHGQHQVFTGCHVPVRSTSEVRAIWSIQEGKRCIGVVWGSFTDFLLFFAICGFLGWIIMKDDNSFRYFLFGWNTF